TAIYSAIKNIPVNNKAAMTGELSIRGLVMPVGGVLAKVEAARHAGATKVFIPKDNYQALLEKVQGIEVVAVERLEEVINGALLIDQVDKVVEARPALDVLGAGNFIPATSLSTDG